MLGEMHNKNILFPMGQAHRRSPAMRIVALRSRPLLRPATGYTCNEGSLRYFPSPRDSATGCTLCETFLHFITKCSAESRKIFIYFYFPGLKPGAIKISPLRGFQLPLRCCRRLQPLLGCATSALQLY